MIKSESQWTPEVYSLVVVFEMLASTARAQKRDTKDPVVRDIGAMREPFVDRFHIERLDIAAFKLHEPAKMPRPQSPLIGVYVTVIKDGDFFRAVYRSYDPSCKGEQYDGNPGEMTCFAESRDGHEWTLPKLGIV